MTDYSTWTKKQLVERLRILEEQLQQSLHMERRRTQAALRESSERLRAILETAVEGIITIDDRGIIESFNSASEGIFGYKAHEVIGKNVSVLMPEPYRREHDSYLANYERSGRPKIIGIGREVVGKRKDGSTFPMDLAVSEVKLENKRLFTGFVRDITERKRLEKEILDISDIEQRRIGQGLHDGLCQHLAGIELMSEVLAKNLGKKSKSDGAQAARIAEHVRDAISQTKMLARGLSPVSMESNGLMSALLELCTAVTKLFNIDCRFHCDNKVLVRDNSTATHLYRIAQEAINNAIRHGKAKTIIITLEKKGNKASLTVTDDGSGVDKTPVNGCGMGMQIMKYRAGMIGATLEIHPASKTGTVVNCSFKAEL